MHQGSLQGPSSSARRRSPARGNVLSGYRGGSGATWQEAARRPPAAHLQAVPGQLLRDLPRVLEDLRPTEKPSFARFFGLKAALLLQSLPLRYPRPLPYDFRRGAPMEDHVEPAPL